MPPLLSALFAAFGFAAFQTVNHRALAGVGVLPGTATLLAIGTVLLTAVAAATGGLPLVLDASAGALALAAAAGVVHFVGGWTFLGWSQVRLGASRTGILLGTVPLFGAVAAALLLDQPLGPFGVVGLLVVTWGVGMVSTSRRNPATPGVAELRPRDVRIGVVAGLATALCWSTSPVLIGFALDDLPSPVTVAAVGMAAGATLYWLGVFATRGGRPRARIATGPRRLLLAAGALASLGTWMQWNALGGAAVAPVLAVVSATPLLVVILAAVSGGERLRGSARVRVWGGAVLTVAGSLLIVAAT